MLQERSTCDNHQEVQIKGQIHSINYSLEYKLNRGNSSTQFINLVNLTSLLLWWVTIGNSKDQRSLKSRDGWRIKLKSNGVINLLSFSGIFGSSGYFLGSSGLSPEVSDFLRKFRTFCGSSGFSAEVLDFPRKFRTLNFSMSYPEYPFENQLMVNCYDSIHVLR